MLYLSEKQKVFLAIVVAALGYFVDLFDMQLFSVVRINSLKDLGLSADQLMAVGAQLLNWQLAGMLLGGILWGILGDKNGRTYALFGTILLYSAGNIANAFVTSIPAYAAARFFTGFGLAGEIGAGVTLVSELLPKDKRSIATTIIIASGFLGSLAAALVAKRFAWRDAYIGGGVLGLGLLFMRMAVHESGIFKEIQKTQIPRGNFLMLFTDRARSVRFFCCIAIALPVWFILSVLVVFSPELGMALGILEPIKVTTSLMYFAIFQTAGGFLSGYLSHRLKNRKKILFLFVMGALISSFVITFAQDVSASLFYGLIGVCAFFTGLWVVSIATTAEAFGTNLRATAAVSAPNFVRASAIVTTFLLTRLKPEYGFVTSVRMIAVLVFCISFLALWKLPETFGRDLDFIEE